MSSSELTKFELQRHAAVPAGGDELGIVGVKPLLPAIAHDLDGRPNDRPAPIVSGFWSIHASSTSSTLRPAGDALPGPTFNEAAIRCVSRLPPRTVREICVGRTRASLPVKTRTSHTPGFFSRIVAMQTTVRQRKSLGMKLGMADQRAKPPIVKMLRITRYAGRRWSG